MIMFLNTQHNNQFLNHVSTQTYEKESNLIPGEFLKNSLIGSNWLHYDMKSITAASPITEQQFKTMYEQGGKLTFKTEANCSTSPTMHQ